MTSAVLASPDCSPGADMIDPRCYGAIGDDQHPDAQAIQAAINAAIATHKPLYLANTGSAYRVDQELTIDYAPIASEGFHIISHGARIDGNSIQDGPVLLIICGGGTTAAPKGCFYFRQEGTLFIDAHTTGNAVRVGQFDMSDAHNSPVFDHLIVNNGGIGGAVWMNYVLNASAFIVANSAGTIGLGLGQAQFGTWRGAASANNGAALHIDTGYTFGNIFEALGLEASPICVQVLQGHAASNTMIGGTLACGQDVSDATHQLQIINANLTNE